MNTISRRAVLAGALTTLIESPMQAIAAPAPPSELRSEEHTSELQSH